MATDSSAQGSQASKPLALDIVTRSAVSRRNTLVPRRVDVVYEGLPVTFAAEGERVAFFASFSESENVTKSVVEFVRQLTALHYDVVFIRASDNPRPLVWPNGQPKEIIVLRKPNIGYDFGSWAVGMSRHKELLSRNYVLLVNDSLAGPFASIEPMVADFERSICDAWGATRSKQFMPHLQSYFLGFKNQSLLDSSIRHFWNNLPLVGDKDTIVQRYEMGLTRLLFAEGFVTTACYEPERVVAEGDNPTIAGWRRLLDLGFPFVKRTIISAPELVTNGSTIGTVVREYYGADIRDWI